MLCPNECYSMAACIDGTSNTILVSEISDYFYSQHTGSNTTSKNKSKRIRIDGSFTNGGSGNPTGGWWFIGTINGYTSSQGSKNWAPSYNLTTLRAYSGQGAPPNSCIGFNGKNVNVNAGNGGNTLGGTTFQGIGQGMGNNPLLSAHPNVVLAVFMDGHTHAVTKNTPAPIVKRLGTRDDGQQIMGDL